ncbi:MAG: cupin domain-containing protein [Emcibacteraceae bacterium]|nr:cupin domain-containing protein [Emcibacteraceae bacterium]
MTDAVITLSSFPNATEFYKTYWNKKPFVVKGGIKDEVTDELIPADELAGLSLEEDVRSRIVMTGKSHADWTCEHGPFDEDVFSKLPEENWSLLVQDVEKYHPSTANVITPFDFSPKWLIDDVMVSYSVPGGGVGPHLDSYHVFLIQGQGKRIWKLGRSAINNEKYIEDIDLKILRDDFIGDVFEVTSGDVIYIPPRFPHSGETQEESLTYSIGFLGPSLSEMMVEFGQFIEEQDSLNKRYDADSLKPNSAGLNMVSEEVDNFRTTMIDAINSEKFDEWLRDYFLGDPD